MISRYLGVALQHCRTVVREVKIIASVFIAHLQDCLDVADISSGSLALAGCSIIIAAGRHCEQLTQNWSTALQADCS